MAVGEYIGNGCPDGSSFGQSGEKISFYGATPIVQATLAANGTDAATTQALANDIKAKLKSIGLFA